MGLTVLDLFSGIGGFSLGLERAGMKTIAFCEIDPFCQKVLRKHWPDVPIYEDIREIDGSEITADVVTGGYPCQPFSQAGKRRGEEDDRHLWPEMYRVIKAVRPRWVIAENVAGHISMGLDSVLSDLEAEDYTCWPFVIPACAVDAKHRRDRVWILAADARYNRGSAEQERQYEGAEEPFGDRGLEAGSDVGNANVARHDRKKESGIYRSEENERISNHIGNAGCFRRKDVADAKYGRCERWNEEGRRAGAAMPYSRWQSEPNVGRVANGVPRRVDRLKSLGNAVVPQIPEIIGRAIIEVQQQEGNVDMDTEDSPGHGGISA